MVIDLPGVSDLLQIPASHEPADVSLTATGSVRSEPFIIRVAPKGD